MHLIIMLIALLAVPVNLYAQEAKLSCQEVQDLIKVMGNDETMRLLNELGMECGCITEEYISELSLIQADEAIINMVTELRANCDEPMVSEEEEKPGDRFSIGARVRYNADITPRSDDDYYYAASNAAFDINLSYKLFSTVYIELGGSRFNADVTPWFDSGKEDTIGDLTITSFTGGLLFRDALKMFDIPSVNMGVGVIYFTADELETDNLWLTRDDNNYRVNKIEVDSAMGFYVGAGYEYFVTDSLSFDLDGKVMLNSAKMNTTLDVTRLGDEEGDSINISYFSIGFGLKYYLF